MKNLHLICTPFPGPALRKPVAWLFSALRTGCLPFVTRTGHQFNGSGWLSAPFRSVCVLLAIAVGILVPTSAWAQSSVPIVFSNDTGMSSSQIFIQFLGGHPVDGSYFDAITGIQTQLQSNTAYSLDQITNPTTGKSQINLSSVDSGRVYVSFGPYGLQNLGADNGGYTPSAQDPLDANYGTRYQYWEPTVVQAGGGATIYADLTYIDFTAISFSMSARNSNGTINTTVSNGNQSSSFGQPLVNQAWSSSGNSTQAIMPSGASTNLPNSEFARVISPQFSSNGTYTDFTNYLNHLGATSGNATISGEFVGTATQQTPEDKRQDYNYIATFSGNATTGNVTLTAQTGSGTGGVGSSVTIVIDNADLNSQLGIYGNDVPYSINGAPKTAGITNDVYGRIVGDLLAGLSFGYVGSNQTFTSGNVTKTIGLVSSTEWWAGGETNGPVPIGNGGNATVAWSDTPAGQGIYFQGAQPYNADYYNQYAASLAAIDPATGKAYTTGYGFPLQDRLGNNLLVYNTAATPSTYLLLNINPDGPTALPTSIWSGNATNGQWGTAANWNTVPGGNSSVQFVGNYTQTVTVDTGTDRSVAGIAFNYAAGNFTIANNTITLSGDVVNSSSKTQTINSNLTLGSNGTVTAAFGDLVFGGAIALSNSGTPHTLTFSGTQNSTVSGVISDGTAPGGSLAKSGTGMLTLNGNNTFTGGLNHQAGTVVLGSDQAAGNGTLTLGKAAAADVILQAAGGNRTLANALAIAGNTTFSGSNGFSFSGPTTLTATTIPSGNSTTTFKNFTVTNSVDVEFGGAIGETVLGTGSSFTKAGGGNMTFSGNSANTFTGGLSVNNGALMLNKSSGVAYGGNLTVGDGTGSAGSAVVRLMGNNQTPGTGITIGTDGQLDMQTFNATAGNITMTGGSITGTGSLSISNGSSVFFTGTGNSTATIGVGLDLGSGSISFQTNNNAAATEMIVSGPITGNGSFTKSGSGTLAITGNNSFDGSVTISGGTLATSSINATVSVSNGALSPGGTGTISSITLGNLFSTTTNATAGAFALDLGTGNSSDLITVNSPGIINIGNGAVFLFSSAGFSGGSGNFTLVSGNWQAAPTPSTFTFASIDIAGLTGTFGYSGGNLTFSAQAGVTETWNGGGGNGSWATAANWQGGTVPASGADLIFTGSSQTNIATAGARTTGAMTFDSAASAFTIGGDTITLGGNIANNSNSTQTINSAIVLNSDRVITANTGNLVFSANIALSNTAALPGTLTFSGNSSTLVSGVISDGPAAGGSLVKTGSGTLTLTGNNSFTGPLTIAGGTLEANASEALGNGLTVTTNTLVFDGGTLRAIDDINAGAPVTRTVQLLGNGTMDSNGHEITIGGPIVGSGSLTKTGAGNLTLTQGGATNNSYSGETIVQQGSLFVGYAGALGAATGGTSVQSGGSLVIANQFNVVGESLTLNGTGDGGNGALRLAAGVQSSWSGNITLADNSSIQADANSILTLAQIDIGGNTVTFTGTNSTINLAGNLSGSGALIVNSAGTGTLNVSGSNTGFTGNVSVQSGTLGMQSSQALGSGTSSLSVASGGTILLESTGNLAAGFSSISLNGTGAGGLGALFNAGKITTVAGDITLGGGTLVSSVSGNLTLTGNVANGGNLLTVSNTGGQMTFSGVISGGGGLTVNGTGGLTLSGNNTFGGGTTVNSGASVTVASNTALGSGNSTVAFGGTLLFQGGVNVATGNLTVNGAGVNSGGALQNVSGNNTYGGGITLASTPYIVSNNGTLTLSGSISGSGNTIIQGPGTVYFSGDTSGYTGGQVQVFSGTFASGNMTGLTVNVAAQAPTAGEIPAYSPNNLGSGGNTTVGGLITNPGARLLLDIGDTASQTDQISSGTFGLDPSTLFVFYNNGFTTSGNWTIFNKTTAGNVNWDSANLKFQAEFSGLSGSFSGDNTQQLIFNAVAGPAVWDNGAANGLWGSAGNWQTGNTPGGGSAVAFGSANATTVDTQVDRLAGDITFQSGSAALTLGNNTITTYGRIRNESGLTQTITSGLALSGNASVDASSGNLVISGPVNFGNSTTRTLTFTGGNNTTVSGVISGGNATTGALVKTGTGTLTLTGNSTFAGTTTISSGTLVLNGSLSSGNEVMVEAGGTLAGSGNAAGQVTVAGTLSPGNSPGTLSSGSEVWLNGGDFNWQVFDATETAAGTGYDTISLTGGLDLTNLTSGGFSINLWSLSAVGPDSNGNAINFIDTNNYSWTLVSTTTGITGFSAGDFAVHVTPNNGTAGFSNPYSGSFTVGVSGNNLMLNYTAIPEPSTWVLLAGAAIVLTLLRWRTRRTLPR